MSCCTDSLKRTLAATGALEAWARELAHLDVPPRRADDSPDTILYNGTFLLAATRSGETVSAVRSRNGKITDVGDYARIVKEAGPATQSVNLNGAVVAPGFVEAHAHIISAIQLVYSTDLRGMSFEAATAAIQQAVTAAKLTGWVFFVNFDPSLMTFTPGVGFPQLDFDYFEKSITNDKLVKIFVENASGHIAYANRLAFAAAGVKPGEKVSGGGSYGEGVMFEAPSFTPFLKHAPIVKLLEDGYAAMRAFLASAQRAGITTVADPAVQATTVDLDLYHKLANDPKAATKIVGSLVLEGLFDRTSPLPPGLTMPAAPGACGSYKNLTIPNLKIWSDGSTQGYTGYLTAPYLPPVTPSGLSDCGKPDWSQADLDARVAWAKQHNWSVLIHANGDAALDMALASVGKAYPAGSAFRNRIEHCTVTRAEQYDTMRQLGLTPTYLSNHIAIWGDTFRDNILGAERASRLDAAGDAVQRGMIFSLHCDYLTSLPGPLQYMQTMVTRRTNSGTVLGAEYAVTQLEALKAVTIYPAVQLGIDASVGTIEAGKSADFVVLAQDPTTVPPETIASIPVQATWLNGNAIPLAD